MLRFLIVNLELLHEMHFRAVRALAHVAFQFQSLLKCQKTEAWDSRSSVTSTTTGCCILSKADWSRLHGLFMPAVADHGSPPGAPASSSAIMRVDISA